MTQELGKILVIAIRELLKGYYYLCEPMQARSLNGVATGNSENERWISLARSELKYCI